MKVYYTAALEESNEGGSVRSLTLPRTSYAADAAGHGDILTRTYLFRTRMIGQFQFADVQWLSAAVRHEHHLVSQDDLKQRHVERSMTSTAATYTFAFGTQLVEWLDLKPGTFGAADIERHAHGILFQECWQTFVHGDVFVALHVQQLDDRVAVLDDRARLLAVLLVVLTLLGVGGRLKFLQISCDVRTLQGIPVLRLRTVPMAGIDTKQAIYGGEEDNHRALMLAAARVYLGISSAASEDHRHRVEQHNDRRPI